MAKTLVKDSPHEEMIRSGTQVHTTEPRLLLECPHGRRCWWTRWRRCRSCGYGHAGVLEVSFLEKFFCGHPFADTGNWFVAFSSPMILSSKWIKLLAIIAQYAVIFMSMSMSWRFLVKIAISEKRRQQNILDCTKKTRQ